MFKPLLKYFKSRVLMATFFNNIQTWDMRQSGRERGSSGEVAAQSTTLPHSRFSGHKNTVEQRGGCSANIEYWKTTQQTLIKLFTCQPHIVDT